MKTLFVIAFAVAMRLAVAIQPNITAAHRPDRLHDWNVMTVTESGNVSVITGLTKKQADHTAARLRRLIPCWDWLQSRPTSGMCWAVIDPDDLKTVEEFR